MPRLFLISLAIASMLGLGWVTRAFASPWRRAVVQKELETAERVDLAGVATIELPPGFKPVGRGWGNSREGHFSPATLDQHRDAYQIMFRFEQGQHHVPGGYLADPVLLNVTLYNPGRAKPDATKIMSRVPPNTRTRVSTPNSSFTSRVMPKIAPTIVSSSTSSIG